VKDKDIVEPKKGGKMSEYEKYDDLERIKRIEFFVLKD